MVTVWWSAAGLIHHSFQSPGETITCEKYAQQIGEMHGQLQHLRWPWSTERAPFFSMTTPPHTPHNQHFKSRATWAMKFCLICHIHLTSCQLITTSSISIIFCRESASTTSRRPKMLSKSLSSKTQIFMLRE